MEPRMAATAKRALALIILMGAFAVQAAEIVVFSGGGFAAAMGELGPAFESATGHKVATIFGSNDALERRIKAEERFDVLLIGTPTYGLLGDRIALAPRVVVGRAGLGVAVRAGAARPDIGSPDALRRTLLAVSSVSFVGDGLSGVLLAGLIERLGIGEAMKPKLKPTAVANVAKAVANGEAELVVHVMPGILAEPGVQLLGPVPGDLQSYIDLTAGLSAAAREPEAAKSFIAFLSSEAGVRLIRGKGW